MKSGSGQQKLSFSLVFVQVIQDKSKVLDVSPILTGLDLTNFKDVHIAHIADIDALT